jgi:hypothetical protein
MITPQDPPGFVVRTEAQKAAWDNGFRLERGIENGGWLHYGSTTAHGEIRIAGVPPHGPWLLSINHAGGRGRARRLAGIADRWTRRRHLRARHADRASLGA